MKIEYFHGQILTKLPHERSSIEAVIDRYVEKSKAYYLEDGPVKLDEGRAAGEAGGGIKALGTRAPVS